MIANKQKNRILLTGAAGFVGAETVKELIGQGFYVVGIDNLNDYYDVRMKNFRLNELKSLESFEFISGDIEDKECLAQVFKNYQFDAVINLAARAGVRYSMENPDVYLSTNINGTLNLLNLMKDYACEKLVLASTSSLYAGQKMPFLEDLPVNNPISPYAASKKAAEVLAYTYHHLYGIDVSIVRYFTVYGPASRPDMAFFRFIKWIDNGESIELFGDGEQSRDFTYVTDVAKGTIKALKKVGYEIINIGGGNDPVSMNYIISKIEKYLDKKALIDYKPFHKADMKKTWADISKANKLLDWQPIISVDVGIEATVKWYLDNIDFCQKINL